MKSKTNGIRVISAMNRKGGCGKSTFCRALASAAVARGETVTIFDTDNSRSCGKWMDDAKAQGNWSPLIDVISTMNVATVQTAIEQIYEQADQEHLILIDTFGGGSEAQDELALASHLIVTPMMLSRGDLAETRETTQWYVNLRKRIDDPAAMPPVGVLVNRVAARVAEAEKAILAEVFSTLPVYENFLQNRAAYVRMDGEGLLGVIRDKQENRALAQHLQNAIEEADSLLTELDAAIAKQSEVA